MGPDLSRVGASRSISYLIDSIRRPDKELSSGMLDPNNHYGPQLVHDTVTVVTAGVEKITGVARNEDTFSVQLKKSTQGRSGRAAVLQWRIALAHFSDRVPRRYRTLSL